MLMQVKLQPRCRCHRTAGPTRWLPWTATRIGATCLRDANLAMLAAAAKGRAMIEPAHIPQLCRINDSVSTLALHPHRQLVAAALGTEGAA